MSWLIAVHIADLSDAMDRVVCVWSQGCGDDGVFPHQNSSDFFFIAAASQKMLHPLLPWRSSQAWIPLAAPNSVNNLLSGAH